MRDQWQLWKNSLSTEKCKELVELCKSFPEQKASTFNNGDDDVRRSKVRWVFDNGVSNLLYSYADEANRNVFNFDLLKPYDVQFTEYTAGNLGFYDWHHDVDWTSNRMYDRKLSVIIQLTDPSEYEGGDFLFKEVSNPDFKAQGSVLVFPSYLTHMISPVTKGTRNSLVTWIEGPRWR